MKKHLFTFILLVGFALINNLQAQTIVKQSEVPKQVLKSYHSHNSKGIKDSIWTKKTITIYHVNYEEDGYKYQAEYFDNGDWIKTVNEIPVTEVPETVKKLALNMYPGYVITKSYNELNNDGKFYALDIEKDKDKMTIYFTPSGKFFK